VSDTPRIDIVQRVLDAADFGDGSRIVAMAIIGALAEHDEANALHIVAHRPEPVPPDEQGDADEVFICADCDEEKTWPVALSNHVQREHHRPMTHDERISRPSKKDTAP
jgi:hypothetical protein